jgi:hypothetical protein
VSSVLIAQALFRDADKCPVVCGASWDDAQECAVLNIVGDGVPEVDEVSAQFTQRTPLSVTFHPVSMKKP